MSNLFIGIGSALLMLITAFMFVKANELSDLFYAFLESIIGFVPYVLGAVIIYCLGVYSATKKYREENIDYEIENENLRIENSQMKELLKQVFSAHEDDTRTIEALRSELRFSKIQHTMSQIADMDVDDATDLQPSIEED